MPSCHAQSLTVVKRSLSSFSSSVRCKFAQDDSIYFPCVFFSISRLLGEFLTVQCVLSAACVRDLPLTLGRTFKQEEPE